MNQVALPSCNPASAAAPARGPRHAAWVITNTICGPGIRLTRPVTTAKAASLAGSNIALPSVATMPGSTPLGV